MANSIRLCLKNIIVVSLLCFLVACTSKQTDVRKNFEYFQAHYDEVEPTLKLCHDNQDKLSKVMKLNCKDAAQAKMLHLPDRSHKKYETF